MVLCAAVAAAVAAGRDALQAAQKVSEASARAALAFPNAYGLTVRYAMKASPNAAILQVRQ